MTHPTDLPGRHPLPAPSGAPRLPGAGLWLVALVALLVMAMATTTFATLYLTGALPGGTSATAFRYAGAGSDLRDECADGSTVSCGDPYRQSPGGSDDSFSALRDSCAGGSMSACDDLYSQTPVGSDDESFGSDCGGRADDVTGGCEELGLDPGYLDLLYDGCASGSAADCDELYAETLAGTDYEYFGSTCGGRSEETYGGCD